MDQWIVDGAILTHVVQTRHQFLIGRTDQAEFPFESVLVWST